MTVTDAATDNVSGAIETSDKVASHLHPQGSFNPDDHAVPNGLEEIWRFTPLKRLRGLHKDAPFGAGNVTFSTELAEGVTAREVPASDPVVGSSGYVPSDRVSARAWQAAETAIVITIPKEAEVPGATILSHTGVSTETASAGHAVIIAEPFSVATVVLRFEGSAVVADNIEFVIGDGAKLTVVSVQDWADDAVHHSTQHAHVGKDALLRHVAVSFGGDLVRMNVSLDYDSVGGEADLLGLYFADAGQHLEHRLFVDHNKPKSISNVDYKGALQGEKAHTVWIGDVLIRKAAEGITTYESNRNLVLTDGCKAEAVPNLEIETGEILGAGHAATTGRFDDEQLFYLRSRGIDETEARRLVVHGFFADIISKIGVPDLEKALMIAVEKELAINIGTPDSYADGSYAPVEELHELAAEPTSGSHH
ncbi:Fe-S cluster assembly protein SufD [Microlunatus soli]|uniref:Iron-regulated ABC transporter permease protein SufD n=1 Tax=Microlunatus soli TaxID=630515 RepID=A0A1H1P2U5_9ACTN|nr:Fe-S cluster assembly protein SufD [Microlunatus soli]SDS05534.1 Iron-regulated ABC transporter permease protein SufD [Microlunatus soli]